MLRQSVGGGGAPLEKALVGADATFSDTDSFTSDFESLGETLKEEAAITAADLGGMRNLLDGIQFKGGIESTEDDDDNPEREVDQVFKHGLLELEQNLNWTAVCEEFTDARSEWVKQVREAESPVQAAQTLVAFSTFIKPECLYDAEFISSDWVLQISQPSVTYAMLCDLLLVLEETINTEADAFNPNWHSKVESWRQALEEVEDYGGEDSSDENHYPFI